MVRKYLVAFATSLGAEVSCSIVDLAPREVDELGDLFAWLRHQGSIVAFSIRPATGSIGSVGLHTLLRELFGDILIDVCLAADPIEAEVPPAYLAPFWPFDHQREGKLASTANFLGLNLEVLATPSDVEEEGCLLPGRPGLWMISARPICSGELFRKFPPTAQ
ncbi:hypothetical protein [Caulobacter sp. BP25]|uniref:hypothetical protein n=1 Tax=Caulobacter sp. BP25 TaxID=2048900 RepID=UPI000C12D99A|nr:hypothetical protein [Caulobacter sp. BP25]PHY22392.1 hypothetical protein CSW59_02955 [Caulobacter sp. BP25]